MIEAGAFSDGVIQTCVLLYCVQRIRMGIIYVPFFMIQRKESYIFEKKYVFGTKTCGLGGNGRNLLKRMPSYIYKTLLNELHDVGCTGLTMHVEKV